MDRKSSRQIPAASPCARAAGGAPWERRAALQPLPRRRSRAASAELAHTAPPAVARWLWSFAPVSLAGGLLSAVAGFPLCAAFVRRSRFPLLWRWFRETLSEHMVGGRQQEQRVSTPLPQKKKNTERVCGSPLPALPLSLCAGFARRPSWSCLLSVCWCCRCCRHSPPSPLAASEENSEKWRLRLPCSAQGLSVRAGQRIQCSIGRQSIERARPPRC